MLDVTGSPATGPFLADNPIRGRLANQMAKGVRFYPCPFILPAMAVCIDRTAFKLVRYFNESYNQFHPYQLVESRVDHMYIKPVLFRKVPCTVLEPAKGQKYVPHEG